MQAFDLLEEAGVPTAPNITVLKTINFIIINILANICGVACFNL